jgi:hypothetical protein
MSDARQPICGRCRFYHVTWDRHFPHGCKAFGLKSKAMPSLTVYQNSGRHCQAFQPKIPGGAK